MRALFKTLFLSLAAGLCLSACGTLNRNTNDSFAQTCSTTPFSRTILYWNTQGGGDLAFSVQETSGCEFAIQVSRYDFHARSSQITVTSASNPEIYLLLSNLFNGYAVLQSNPSGGVTGTWTSITLSGTRYDAPSIVGDNSSRLNALYDYVVAQL